MLLVVWGRGDGVELTPAARVEGSIHVDLSCPPKDFACLCGLESVLLTRRERSRDRVVVWSATAKDDVNDALSLLAASYSGVVVKRSKMPDDVLTAEGGAIVRVGPSAEPVCGVTAMGPYGRSEVVTRAAPGTTELTSLPAFANDAFRCAAERKATCPAVAWIDPLSADRTQQLPEEYLLIWKSIASVEGAPNVLIFGTGRDTPMWCWLVKEARRGRVVFLESDQKWIDFATTHVPGVEVVLVKYYTRIDRDASRLSTSFNQLNASELFSAAVVPQGLRSVAWDVIVVDAPPAYSPELPGRFQSFYSALALAYAKRVGTFTKVFLHDCDRVLEETLGRLYTDGLGPTARVGPKKLTLWDVAGRKV